jgi:ATP-binding cassette subfamily B protein
LADDKLDKADKLEEEALGNFDAFAHLKRLLAYAHPMRALLLVCLFGSCVTSAIQIVTPLLVRAGVDRYMTASGLPMAERLGSLQRLGLLYGLLLAINLAVSYAVSVGLNHIGQSVIVKLRGDVWRHLHRLPLTYFDRNPVGRIVTRVANDSTSLSEVFTSVIATGVADVLILTGVLLIIFRLDLRLAASVATLFLPLLAITLWFKSTSQRVHRRIRVLLARVNAFFQENVQGIAVVKSFVAEQRMQRKFATLNADYYRTDMQLVYLFAIFRPLVSAASTLAMLIVLWQGGLQTLAGVLSLGTLVAFLFYVRMLFAPIDEMAEKFNLLQQALVASERIFRILDTPTESGYAAEPTSATPRVAGHIVFDHVTFAYDEDKPVLRDVSLEIQPGQTVALVGPSGSGKTTIASLLFAFYRLDAPWCSGRILLDGRPLEEWDVRDLRSQIGLVQQDLFLFSADLAHNVTLFTPRPAAALEAALNASQASRLVEKFEDGLSHQLNERGSVLSQGERQLLSFARALAVDPPVLLLDEATASIDSKTEQLIQTALRRMLAGRTALVVAHRLSTVQEADCILVLKKGQIVERGRHDELLAYNGLYAHLFRTQQLDPQP